MYIYIIFVYTDDVCRIHRGICVHIRNNNYTMYTCDRNLSLPYVAFKRGKTYTQGYVHILICIHMYPTMYTCDRTSSRLTRGEQEGGVEIKTLKSI